MAAKKKIVSAKTVDNLVDKKVETVSDEVLSETKVTAEPEVKAEPVSEETKPAVEEKEETKVVKKTTKKTTRVKSDTDEKPKKTVKKTKEKAEKAEDNKEEKPKPKKTTTKKASAKKKEDTKVVEEEKKEEKPVIEVLEDTPRRSVVFIGSECYPFVKSGGLGDVMYALPKELVKQNCDVRVIIPRYKCIKQEWQEKMYYKGAFQMDLCADGRSYYVGIMEYVEDGVTYNFIDNEEFFSNGNPYTSIVDDIPKFCYFSKAALAALNYLDWIPNVIHCHDWQAALVPVFLKEMFKDTPIGSAKTVFTIHNLRFQGIYNISTFKYWTNLPGYVFNDGALKVGREDCNMLKGGISYADKVTTVSETYAYEIQTGLYGESLDGHLRYHSYKLKGIVNGIDVEVWNPGTDKFLAKNYDTSNFLENKRACKKTLQENLGLEVDDHKFVIGLISRLTDQKGLDLVNAIVPSLMDEHTQIVVLGTGEARYEDSFRYYEHAYKGNFCANIMYDEARSHSIYAGCDAFLVPSAFEPCGLTQLISMRYGAVPIVRETGGLKDTVEPYNEYENRGNGFTFDRYDAGLLLDACNRAKTVYFTNRAIWDQMVERDMNKDVSWKQSAKIYKYLYLDLTQW